MAEGRFIKTTAFGGFDKEEVIHRLEYLNSQVFSLKNELRETKLMLEGYKKGTEGEKNFESILAGERAKLTEEQVKSETLSTKLKAAEEDNRMYEEEIENLNAKISELTDQLLNANNKVAAAEAGNEALALSAVFIEAKKSADMLVADAKQKSDKMDADAKAAAEAAIAQANKDSLAIVEEAEQNAAEIIAQAKNDASAMGVASENMRAVILSKVSVLGEQLGLMRDALMKFECDGVGNLYDVEELLSKTETTLTEGGVPIFREPEIFNAETGGKTAAELEEDKQKRKSGLDKLKQMAESIGSGKDKNGADDNKKDDVKDKTEDKADKTESSGKPAAEAKPSGDKKPETSVKKKGKIDLAALSAKAEALKKK